MNSKLLKLNILLILLVFVSFVGCSDAEESKRVPWAPVSNDMTLQDYYLEDEKTAKKWHFRIPIAYLDSDGLSKKLKKEYVFIQTGLPDLKPRKAIFKFSAKVGTEEHEAQEEIFRSGIYITLHPERLTDAYKRNVYKRFNSDAYILKDSGLEGYELYNQKPRCGPKTLKDGTKKEVCIDDGKDYFIPTDINKFKWPHYSCVRTENNKYGGCSVVISYGGMRVVYNIRRSELIDWKKYDEAVRSLLNQFYVNDTHRNK